MAVGGFAMALEVVLAVETLKRKEIFVHSNLLNISSKCFKNES